MKPQRILLGMSGGTDSSVAAMLLQQQDYEVVGVTFRFWDEVSDPYVPEYVQNACELARQLNMEHHVYDLRCEFNAEIVEYFIDEYLAGRTPFPCVKCNSTLKWKLLLRYATQHNCDFISTGHYARITVENGCFYVSEAADPKKDQTFFLWGLTQNILSKAVLPLGGKTKDEIRIFAAQNGFEQIAGRKDSMGICFCPGDYRQFLKKHDRVKKLIKKGNFTDETGRFLGRHESHFFYTIGQRHGLGIQLNEPMFVKEIHPLQNKVVLAPIEHGAKTEIYVENYNVVNTADFTGEFDVITKIRYRNQETMSRISKIDDNTLKIELTEKIYAVAPGQSAVFYRDGKVLGGGIILR